MPICEIFTSPHPVLRQRAAEITDFNESALKLLIQNMTETMLAAPGVGLAAPQIGISQRLIVFRVPPERVSGDALDMPIITPIALINPSFTPVGKNKANDWEGCLSIPRQRGLVPRYTHIRYHGTLPNGRLYAAEATNYHARIIQHEIDHLDGVLYPDYITDPQHLVIDHGQTISD